MKHILNFLFLVQILISVLPAHTIGDDDNSFIVVKLNSGNKLKGIVNQSAYTKKDFVEFRGIPYAKPPVGDLRFKAPVKYDEIWSEEPRDATEFGAVCPQLDPMNPTPEEIVGVEDCLFLNVATPRLKSDSTNKLPVAVWIHGGSFQFESGDAYGPQKFLEHPIVLVTFNFRIGILGFFNSEDGKIQGNMGLKDQVLALKWVKENIAKFGGDPDNITIFGANTGAVSVHLHLLSEMSKGLFHRAISQSGTAISPWVLTRNPARRIERIAKLLVEECGNDTSSYDCLMKTEFDKIISKHQAFAEWYIDPLVPVGPTIELEGDEPKFLSQNPYAVIKKGKFHGKDIPWIVGVNSHEGLLHSADIVNHGILKRVFNWEWLKAAPITLLYRYNAIDGNATSDNIWKYYFEKNKESNKTAEAEPLIRAEQEEFLSDSESPQSADDNNSEAEKQESEVKEVVEESQTVEDDKKDPPKRPNPLDRIQKPPERGYQTTDTFVDKDNLLEEMTNMYSDRYFFHPVHHAARLQAMHGKEGSANVYLYYFEYRGKQSVVDLSGHTDMDYGVSHFDQIQFMFNTPYFNETEGEDSEFSKDYVGGLVRFITNGKLPTDQWKPVTKDMVDGTVPLVYNIIGGKDKAAVTMEEPFTERVQFWDKQLILELEKENIIDSIGEDDFPENNTGEVDSKAEKRKNDEL